MASSDMLKVNAEGLKSVAQDMNAKKEKVLKPKF